MATRNRTPIYRKYRDALRQVRPPVSSSPSTSSGGGGGGSTGPVIEMVSASFLRQDRSYAPLSTEDPGSSRFVPKFMLSFNDCILLLDLNEGRFVYCCLWLCCQFLRSYATVLGKIARLTDFELFLPRVVDLNVVLKGVVELFAFRWDVNCL